MPKIGRNSEFKNFHRVEVDMAFWEVASWLLTGPKSKEQVSMIFWPLDIFKYRPES